jgi:hypothetical protein
MPHEFWFSVRVNEDMEKLNVYSFYTFGGMVKHHADNLQFADRPFDQHIVDLYVLKTWFEIFLERSSDTTWRATRDRARQMVALLGGKDGPDKIEREKIFSTETNSIRSEYVRHIGKLLTIFEATLASENEGSNVFSVSRKGTHDSMALMDVADENLPPDTRARLSPETVRDIRDAGKCLALDCHTASGYHMLRGVERVIIKYLEKVSGKPINPKNRNWGVYIRELKRLGADASVTGYLWHIKEYYRNPVIHPEDTLNASEAFSLFNASLSAIIQLDAAIEAWP